MNNIVLAVVAHPDDEIIGVGGTLAKHIDAGDFVSVLILGDGKSSRNKEYEQLDSKTLKKSISETKNALEILGITNFYKGIFPDNRFDSVTLLDIVKEVSKYIKKLKPSIVYTHHDRDMNIDHQLTAEAVKITCRPIENKFVSEVRMFETLSSTEMAGYTKNSVFLPNLFVNIEAQLARKIKAMDCYTSELHEFPHPRSLEAIEANAKVWGAKTNLRAVEPFFIFRSIQ